MPRLMPIATHLFSPARRRHYTFNGLPSFSAKFPTFSLVFCAAINKSNFRQIVEALPNPLWILHLALYVATSQCVLSVTRYRVYLLTMNKIIPPKGSTTDKKEMEYDYVWADKDSDVQTMAKHYGLKSPQPIMCNTPESGNLLDHVSG